MTTTTLNEVDAYDYEQATEVIAYHAETGHCTDEPCAIVLWYKASLARLNAGIGDTWTNTDVEPEHIGHRPQGGALHANQYGTCKVRRPSEAQARFIARLLVTREVPSTGGEQVALAAFKAGTANLRQATDLISWLINLPEVQGLVDSPSDKQVAYIRSLLDQRDLTATAFTAWDEATVSALTRKEAGAALTLLVSLPRKQVAPVTKDTPRDERQDGMYLVNGVVFKVQYNLAKTGLYAKRLVATTDGASFEYAGSMAKNGIKAEHRMTLDEAKHYGALYGTCVCCGRTLTDEGSIEAGIGPVCASKGGWA